MNALASPAIERAAIVGLVAGSMRRDDAEAWLDELGALVDAAGGQVCLRFLQERPAPDPATFLGSGKLQALVTACDEQGASLVVFDNELTPAQLRNLEKRLDRKVVDRTQLILDIFARRARTREGKLQVELAQLKYLMPRLVGAAAALSRLGGGIGTRGPGETKLETDRRRVRDRIAALTAQIADVRRHRARQRDRRHRGSLPTVALVGYTNAGKTTLFNRLGRQTAWASPQLFATLDPLVRQVKVSPQATILLSDTVGFIDRLPHSLVAAFRATLEEVVNADLLLHLVDASHPDLDRHVRAVHRVLDEIGAGMVASLLVFNKIDRVPHARRLALLREHPGSLAISATDGTGIETLQAALSERLELDIRRIRVELADDARGRKTVAALYRHARVLRHEADSGRVSLEVELPRRLATRFSHELPVEDWA